MMIAKNNTATTSQSKWKPYPTYTDSGVEWLGKIPTHWEEKRLRFVCWVNPSKSEIAGRPPSTEVSFLPMEAIGEDGKLNGVETRTLEQVWQGYTYFRDGDVIVAKITPCFENGKGALCKELLGSIGFGTTELQVLRPRDAAFAPFVFYLTQSHPFRNLGIASMKGVAGQQRITDDFIKDFRAGLPSILEQKGIVAFLDQETAKIDALMAKKERLIELLQEKRATLITRAVTKGLNPNIRMKDSGVEWLGEIPAHWEVKRLKFVLAAPLKYGANEAAELDDPDLPRYVRITDIDENDGLRDETFKSLPAEVAAEFILREGDLLFARSGATAGKTFLYRRGWGTCAYAGYLIRARLDTRRACPEFVRYFTASLSYWQWLSVTFIQATIQNVSAERYASLVVPQPSDREQRAITAFLDRETAKIDALVAKVREGIEKLKEYRTALISAAVTGKIDVREEI